MQPTNANFTSEYIMQALETMSKQIESLKKTVNAQDEQIEAMQQTVKAQDERIQALAQENLNLRAATSATEILSKDTEVRISNNSEAYNETFERLDREISVLKDGDLARTTFCTEFEEAAGEFYDKVGEFNNGILARVQRLEKKAGIVTVSEAHDKEATERLVSPYFDRRPVSLGKSTATPKENKFLKELNKADTETKAPTVVVHTFVQNSEHKGRAREATNMSPINEVHSDSETF